MGRKAAARDSTRREWNAHVKGGWVALFLWQGSRLTTLEIARLCGMTKQGAQKMMVNMEADMQITLVDGKWQWISKD